MANIDIKDISSLDINGNSLFDDSESFLIHIDDTEVDNTKGGITPAIILTVTLLTPVPAY